MEAKYDIFCELEAQHKNRLFVSTYYQLQLRFNCAIILLSLLSVIPKDSATQWNSRNFRYMKYGGSSFC